MEIIESIRAAFKELIVPELDRIKEENREIRAILELTNKRLDDVNVHMADQSRRIDALRGEMVFEIKDTNNRIDSLREEMISQIKDTNNRIDSLREAMVSETKETNKRIDRLYEVIVRREEHSQLAQRLISLEREVAEIKRKIAA